MPLSRTAMCTRPSLRYSGQKQPEAQSRLWLRGAVFRQHRKGLGVTKAAQGPLLQNVQLALLSEILHLGWCHHRQTPARPTPGARQGMQRSREVDAHQYKTPGHPCQLTHHPHTHVMTIAMMQQTDA